MHLTALDVRDFRGVASAALEPISGLNVIVGPNAAGKTSLLEAVHVLSTGRSFAATRTAPLVRHGAGPLRVVGRVVDASGRMRRLGVERGRSGPATLRLDGSSAERVTELARVLPTIAIHPESHDIIIGGPDERRRLVDLGLFHVEPRFHEIWRRFRRALAQRNALLRQGAGDEAFEPWDRELASVGEALDRARRRYVDQLAEIAGQMQPRLLGSDQDLELGYRRGWPEDRDLLEALRQERRRSGERGGTSVGPHRADLALRVEGREARQQISRGQQKLVVYLLRLAQAQQLVWSDAGGCVLLLDDLPAELDRERRERVMALAAEIGAQVFVTGLESQGVPRPEGMSSRLFHVEQGQVREMV